MRVTGIQLKNFKRFSDLTIRDIPKTARLVVVVGPNGCGKSSLFDALLQWYRINAGFGEGSDDTYYRKSDEIPFNHRQSVAVTLADGASARRGCLYIRTAYRNDPDFTMNRLDRPQSPVDNVRVNRSIENDQTVSQNYQQLVYDTMAGVYNTANDGKLVEKLRDELIGSLRDSMKAVFGDLLLNNITDPLGGGAFYFSKGAAKYYHYKNLSGGEKAAFDLLLDLHVKKRFFQDAVYGVDEIETHLHTRVQGRLVQEMVKILPAESQLWVTTHSLGVLRAAQELEAETRGSVCLLDFDGVEPDSSHVLIPSSLDRVAWEKMLSISLDDLSKRVAPRVVVVCEGTTLGNRRKDFDAEIYNRILGSQVADVAFVSGGNSQQVVQTGATIEAVLRSVSPATRTVPVCDRDAKTPAEVADFERRGGLVLKRRHLESYLLDDEVITALLDREGKAGLLADALKIKADAVAASVARGNPQDDLKSAAGEIQVGLVRLLSLSQAGSNSDAFLRDTLAPLIRPTTKVYAELKAELVDRLP